MENPQYLVAVILGNRHFTCFKYNPKSSIIESFTLKSSSLSEMNFKLKMALRVVKEVPPFVSGGIFMFSNQSWLSKWSLITKQCLWPGMASFLSPIPKCGSVSINESAEFKYVF